MTLQWVSDTFTLIYQSADPVANQHADFDRWLAEHDKVLGAGESAALVFPTSWSSPLTVYGRKKGLIHVEDNEPMKWGRLLEDRVAEGYLAPDETGRLGTRDGNLWVSRDQPHLGATPDYWLAPCADAPAEGPGLLEIKTANARQKDVWREAEHLVPPYYYLQVQQQLAVTGLRWASVACLFGGQELLWVDLTRDDAMIERLVEATRAFWHNHIATDTPPEPSGVSSDTSVIDALYPERLPDMIQLGEDASIIDDHLQCVKGELRELQSEKTKLEQRLRMLIGPHEAAALPGGVTYTLQHTTRAAYTVPAKTVKTLRRKQEK